MKKTVLALLLAAVLLLAGCSAQTQETSSEMPFVFSEETGYGLKGLDYGGSAEELGKVIGCTLSDTEGAAGTSAADDGTYYSQITEFLGTKGYFDAQFTDGDTGFYSVTFHANSNYGNPKSAFDALQDACVNAFGDPDITGTEGLPDSITERLRWEHEASDTMLEIRFSGDEEQGGLLVGLADLSALR